MEWELRTLTLGINRVSLQLLLSTEFTQQDCTKWANDLLAKKDVKGTISPLMTKWLQDSSTSGLLAFLTLKSQSLASGIISFTSSIEFYLKDLIIECLRRNSNLRKKGFNFKKDNFDASYLFSPRNLEEHASIEKAKIQVMKQLASIFSKGETFSEKYKKVNSFLDLDSNAINKYWFNCLDSIWHLRNKIAHTDSDKIDWVFESIDGTEIKYNEYQEEEYFPFVIELIRVIDATEQAFISIDSKAKAKWPLLEEISNVHFP